MTTLVTTKINCSKRTVDGGSLTLQAMPLYIQRLETAVPGFAGNRCFCLLGSIPNPLNRPLRWSGCAAFRRFRLPSAVDFPLPAPLRGLRFFRRDRRVPIKGLAVWLPRLFPKIVEVAQVRRELAFPEGVLLIGQFSGIVQGAGFHKSQSAVLEQCARTAHDGIQVGLELVHRHTVPEYEMDLPIHLGWIQSIDFFQLV